METTFQELKQKQVINVVDGKTLGRIVDFVMDIKSCKIIGFVVPNCSGWGGWFKSNKDLFIPFNCICKIGVDVILVELYDNTPSQKCDVCNDKKRPKEVYALNNVDYEVK